MSALIYGHENDHASLEVTRASVDEHGVPMTCVSIEDNRCQRDIYFTPPALRALHVAIGIRLVETDRLQTGRPARLVRVERDERGMSYTCEDTGVELASVSQNANTNVWIWHITAGCRCGGYRVTLDEATSEATAILRARGYVVEGA
ncbi:MAG: hypothetical protein ACRC4O_10930 [Giesbergeria sp.]